MPFGLCNAPSAFQKLMDVVLADLQGTLVLYIWRTLLLLEGLWRNILKSSMLLFQAAQSHTFKGKASEMLIVWKESKIYTLYHIYWRSSNRAFKNWGSCPSLEMSATVASPPLFQLQKREINLARQNLLWQPQRDHHLAETQLAVAWEAVSVKCVNVQSISGVPLEAKGALRSMPTIMCLFNRCSLMSVTLWKQV